MLSHALSAILKNRSKIFVGVACILGLGVFLANAQNNARNVDGHESNVTNTPSRGNTTPANGGVGTETYSTDSQRNDDEKPRQNFCMHSICNDVTHVWNTNESKVARIQESRGQFITDTWINRIVAKNAAPQHDRWMRIITKDMIAHSVLNGSVNVVTEKIMLPPIKVSGIATTYAKGDGFSGDTFGCVRESRRLLGSSTFRDDLPTVAMRPEFGVPCGGLVYVERAGLRVLAIRMDAGPWNRHPDGTYRGIIDLTPTVAEAIDLPGKGVMRRGRVMLRF